MRMDINKFMRKCIRHLGLPALSLEKYYPAILEVLQEDTLSVFSQFFPYTYILSKDLSKEKGVKAPDYGEIYYIRDKFLEDNNLDIISVEQVEGASFFSDWNAPLQTFNVDAMILEAAASNIRSQLNISTKSFEFMPPNRLKLRGYKGYEDIRIKVKIPYPNFGTVPIAIEEPLLELAKLDIKLLLYPELKMYDKLDTADGSIDLKLDGWENAEVERKDLIAEWRNKAFPNSTSKYYVYE
jgi:hypothetical protein